MNLQLPGSDFLCWIFPAESVQYKSAVIISPTGLSLIVFLAVAVSNGLPP